MKIAQQIIPKKEFDHPHITTSNGLKKRTYLIVKKTLGGFFKQSNMRNLDYKMWRHLEFRNECEPEKHSSFNMSRWP